MHFKKLVIDENNSIEEEDAHILKGVLLSETESSIGPMSDIQAGERKAKRTS